MKKFKLLTFALCIGFSIVTYSNCISYCSPQWQYFGSYVVRYGTIPNEVINRYEIMQQFCGNQHVLDNVHDLDSLNALVDSLLHSVTDFNGNFKDNFDNNTVRNVLFPLFSGIAHQISFKSYDLNNTLQQNDYQNFYFSNNIQYKLQQCWQIINSFGI